MLKICIIATYNCNFTCKGKLRVTYQQQNEEGKLIQVFRSFAYHYVAYCSRLHKESSLRALFNSIRLDRPLHRLLSFPVCGQIVFYTTSTYLLLIPTPSPLENYLQTEVGYRKLVHIDQFPLINRLTKNRQVSKLSNRSAIVINSMVGRQIGF